MDPPTGSRLRKGDEHPAYTAIMGHGTLYLFARRSMSEALMG